MGQPLEPHAPLEIEALLRHAGWLRSLARSLVRDPGCADDLVQETWLAALRRPPLAGTSPRAWLGRVVRNLALNRRRDEGTRSVHEFRSGEGERGPSPAEIAREVEAQRVLAEAVAALAEPERTIVVLRYFRGLESAAIGRELGLPAGTVRWRLQKALGALRSELDRRFGGERRAWGLFLAPYAGLPVGMGAASFALVAVGIAALALGTWGLARWSRPPQGPRAVAPRAGPARATEATGTLPAQERPASTAPSAQRSSAPAPWIADPQLPTADIEGRVLLDGEEPGRPIALEVVMLAQRDHPPSGARVLPRNDVRRILTDAQGRFDVFALGPECRFRLRAPGFFWTELDDVETPARGLVVELRTPPELRGRLVSAEREPVHGPAGTFWLEAEHDGWQLFDGPGEVDCDAEGHFTVSLLSLMGESRPETCRAQLLFEVPRRGRLQVDTGMLPLEDHDLGTLVLERVCALRFRVRDGRGQPLSGAVARLDDLWLSKPSHPTNGEGFGELRHAPERAARVRFSAFGCEDQVLTLVPGDEPDVWLAPATVLEVQLDRPAHLDGPFPLLILSAREALLEEDSHQTPLPMLLEPGWIQAELGATPLTYRETRKDANGRAFRFAFQPDPGGRARIVGLRPDVWITATAQGAASELALAAGEHRRLELRYGE
jgi:RNA polymerase sigma-70 factor (ECF subfamily)